jgi:hypothetical protein
MEEDPFADHVSNMHRFIDEARARRGLAPLMKRPRVANEDVWESALRKERAHRAAGNQGTAGNVLLAELLLNPVRTLAPWETALLLHEQEAYDTITTFIRSAGSAAGSSLQILKMVIDKRDFTLARVKNEWHAAANAMSDKPVEWTTKDQTAAEEWYKKYEALKTREAELMAENEGYAALLKQLTEDVERAQAKAAAAAKVPAIKTKILSKLTPAAEAARARIAARKAAKEGPPGPDILMQSGPAPEMLEELQDYAILLAEKMVNGVFDFAKASRIIASEFGENMSEFAEWIYADAKRVYNETVESVSTRNSPRRTCGTSPAPTSFREPVAAMFSTTSMPISTRSSRTSPASRLPTCSPTTAGRPPHRRRMCRKPCAASRRWSALEGRSTTSGRDRCRR